MGENIAIFGATGSVGLVLLSQLKEKNNKLTVISRSSDRISKLEPNIRVIKGDVTNPVAVAEAIQGQDIIICLLGSSLRDKKSLRTRGTEVIVNAMKEAGVKRIICLSAFGAGTSRKYLPWHYRFILGPLLMDRMFHDHSGQETILKNSGLDWVIIRPGHFIEGSTGTEYLHGREANSSTQKISLTISREDLADFIVRQLESNVYLHEAAWISYAG
ncbi:NAD(P)H-binding protein [Leptospira sp. 96542]|nr:NAD(P)H-binding protein [Leptospira sp. 96542]